MFRTKVETQINNNNNDEPPQQHTHSARLEKMINFGSNVMHVDQFRKMETYSPKSSPRGGRSPIVSRQDSSGTLKTTISLGKNPSIVHSGPFYLMKEPPGLLLIWSHRSHTSRFQLKLNNSILCFDIQVVVN